MNVRTPESCPWRHPLNGASEAACDILVELTGLAPEGCRVREDGCAFCCGLEPSPTPRSINSLIASYLFDLSRELLELPGQCRADYQKWQSLFELAECNLEVSPACTQNRNRNPVDRWCEHVGPSSGRMLDEVQGPARLTPHYLCRHSGHFETTLEECMDCRDWESSGEDRPVPLDVLLPPLSVQAVEPVRRWAVGVTTAPRQNPRLDETLESITSSGWPDPHLFVDGDAEIPGKWSELPRTQRGRQLGAWPNFYLGLWELVRLHPKAGAYLMFQDDMTLYCGENLREYLERVLWFGHRTAVVSLYCASVYTQPRFGWKRFDGRWVWGAPALIFSPEAARRLLADPQIQRHRGGERQAQTDVAIGRWADQEGVPIFFPTPSLVQHVGETSAIWSRGRAVGSRRANLSLCGENP